MNKTTECKHCIHYDDVESIRHEDRILKRELVEALKDIVYGRGSHSEAIAKAAALITRAEATLGSKYIIEKVKDPEPRYISEEDI